MSSILPAITSIMKPPPPPFNPLVIPWKAFYWVDGPAFQSMNLSIGDPVESWPDETGNGNDFNVKAGDLAKWVTDPPTLQAWRGKTAVRAPSISGANLKMTPGQTWKPTDQIQGAVFAVFDMGDVWGTTTIYQNSFWYAAALRQTNGNRFPGHLARYSNPNPAPQYTLHTGPILQVYSDSARADNTSIRIRRNRKRSFDFAWTNTRGFGWNGDPTLLPSMYAGTSISMLGVLDQDLFEDPNADALHNWACDTYNSSPKSGSYSWRLEDSGLVGSDNPPAGTVSWRSGTTQTILNFQRGFASLATDIFDADGNSMTPLTEWLINEPFVIPATLHINGGPSIPLTNFFVKDRWTATFDAISHTTLPAGTSYTFTFGF